ncbi:MAG: hypothetical protein GY757_48535 [bacterium]|nr:hypothetical protein [bacterium]
MKFVRNAALIITGSLLFSSNTVLASPKPNVYKDGNKWEITFYDDSSDKHNQWATQEICFLKYHKKGTGIEGVWYSTSYPDWNGLYYQEGDEVKMTGDFANDTGHSHMTLIHTTYDWLKKGIKGMAFKDWTEWWEDGSYGKIIGWGNAKMERVGYCKHKSKIKVDVNSLSSSLPERLTVDGDIAVSPAETNLESIEEYKLRNGIE